MINWYLSDRLSQKLVLDGSGNVIGRMAHLPFGEDFAESGTQEKHHFTTYEREAEAGTDYAVNRQYAQSVGRFNRPDPSGGSYQFGNPQSLNRYDYVSDDPINHLDPDGLDCQWVLAPIWDNEGFIHGYHWVIACSSGLVPPRKVDPPDPPKPAPCPQSVRNFFTTNLNLYKRLAEKLHVDVTWLMGLSALESAWLGQHAQDLHNIWGLTNAGGNDLRFSSYQAGTDYWDNLWGSRVANANTVDDFINDLVSNHYNTHQGYGDKLKRVIDTVQRMADNCGIDLTLPPGPG